MTAPTIVNFFTTIPQGDGSYVLRPSSIRQASDGLTTAEFARAAGISRRRVNSLCDEGRIIFRRKTGCKESAKIIPATELEKFLTARNEA